MKRFLFLSFYSLLLLLPTICSAAPLYGPDMPEKGQWYMGFETNLVFERDMRKNLGEAKAKQYFINASYGIYDWFSFDGKLGVGDLEFDTIEAGRLNYDLGLAGAYGVRFKVYNDEAKKTTAVLGLQHISSHSPKEEVKSVKYSGIWDEWQLSFLVSKEVGHFKPYLGVKASQAYVIRKDNLEDDWAWNGSKRHFGIAAGSNVELPKNWYLNIEGRFIDETAVSSALSYRL